MTSQLVPTCHDTRTPTTCMKNPLSFPCYESHLAQQMTLLGATRATSTEQQEAFNVEGITTRNFQCFKSYSYLAFENNSCEFVSGGLQHTNLKTTEILLHKLTNRICYKMYCNNFAGSIFKMEVYYTPEFNTQLLITVRNPSRLLTQV
jgi:hypothetical protein